jgi:hypothetical protein
MFIFGLDPVLEQSIKIIACEMGVTQSELLRKIITEFIERSDELSACELGQAVFGKYASSNDNLSIDRKALIKEKLVNNIGTNV